MKNMKIRSQFLLIVLPLILCSYVILILGTNLVFYQDIVVKQQKAVWDEASIVASQIEKAFTNIASCCKVISRDFNYDENKILVTKKPRSVLEEYQKDLAIRSVLYSNVIFFDEVETLAFIDQDRGLHVSDTRLEENWSEEACDALLAPLHKTGNVDVWVEAGRREYLTADKDEVVITLSKNIMDMASGSQMGQGFAHISEPSLRKYYSELEAPGRSWYIIADTNGKVISSSDESRLLTKLEDLNVLALIGELPGQGYSQREFLLDGQEVIATGVYMKTLRYALINITSLEAVKEPVDHLFYTFILICTVTILAAVILICFFSGRITRPLSLLVEEIRKVEDGNFKVELSRTGSYEIEKLSTEFNYMMSCIDGLFQTVKTKERQKEKLRFSLLQSQIRPHFFYNTLDMVYALISMDRAGDAKNAVKALADFYRIALSSGKELITIGEEAANVENYLLLQHMRRYDVFTYEISIEPSIASYLIPKLTLQPLVENAIYHGLRCQDKPGTLKVTGALKGDAIVLKVTDTGVGMDGEQLESALLNPAGDGGHFGLRSVDERIKLYFGEGFGVFIVSEEGEGTEVSVKIGLREETEDE